ncbi:M14 family zinc carboxypeptidase [Alkalisalibacterium limincola]|uniref:Peptidase M14 n=1 Tax=Alkalisalibacterium limincola TaxID=2699169 RepID=A0A5C8KVM7_9GAMM|nr:M14 family zinc carboxypeptidase [Alkalisalibacterium limincola]TXK64370.1 peptidase M14 [Alkalisalibacterium limincola]
MLNPILLALALASAPATATIDPVPTAWQTPAEASDYTRTPRLDETLEWFEHLARISPLVHVDSFGTSPQGRTMPLVIVATGSEFDAETARDSGKEVVLIQAAIHAGENEGKDALMALVRDIAVHGRHHDLLEHVVLVLLPVFNVDGHERFSPYGRINQNGPEEMGWRVTANNLNLNRDFAKADTPEMQAWLRLWNAWRPDLLVDMHNTNGADYQYALTWAFERAGNLHPAVAAWQEDRFNGRIAPAMAAQGWPLFTYVMMTDRDDIRAGLLEWASSPRYSTGFAAVENRAGLLLETHMLKDFRTRTQVNEAMLLELLKALAHEPGSLREAVRRADAETVARAGRADAALDVAFRTTDETRDVEFLGYEYTTRESELSGGTWVTYDQDSPRTFRIPMRDRFEVTRRVALPAAYLVPAEWSAVIERLEFHDIAIERIASGGEVEAGVYRFQDVTFSPRPVEGRQVVTGFNAALAVERRQVPAGSVLVRLDQPKANTAVHLLEPEAPDSLLYWGLFNAIFEDKEYTEPRVMEAMAREMLAADPALRAEFEQRREDPEFAGDPRAILRFFYQRTPFFDDALNRYPVLRLDAAAAASLTGE